MGAQQVKSTISCLVNPHFFVRIHSAVLKADPLPNWANLQLQVYTKLLSESTQSSGSTYNQCVNLQWNHSRSAVDPQKTMYESAKRICIEKCGSAKLQMYFLLAELSYTYLYIVTSLYITIKHIFSGRKSDPLTTKCTHVLYFIVIFNKIQKIYVVCALHTHTH